MRLPAQSALNGKESNQPGTAPFCRVRAVDRKYNWRRCPPEGTTRTQMTVGSARSASDFLPSFTSDLVHRQTLGCRPKVKASQARRIGAGRAAARATKPATTSCKKQPETGRIKSQQGGSCH